VAWASENAFEALEVAAWPDLGDRPFTATHIRVESFSDRDAENVRVLFDHHGLTLSSLSSTTTTPATATTASAGGRSHDSFARIDPRAPICHGTTAR
jgi:hypothetical protein